VSDIYPVATAAIRQSVNVDGILERVQSEVGMKLKVITGKEEAYYGYHAVTHTISNTDAMTIDIGGGSTESSYFEAKKLIHSISLPFGVVTLKSMFFEDSDHNDKKAIAETEKYVKEQLKGVKWLTKRKVPILAIGGSARNIARIHQSQTNYPIAGVHGYSMSKGELKDVYSLLKNTDRYDVVKADEFKFSRKGIREGMAISIISKDFPDAFDKHEVFKDSLIELANDFKIKPSAAQRRTELAERIFHELEKHQYIDFKKHEKNLM